MSRPLLLPAVFCLFLPDHAFAKVDFGRDIQPLLKQHCVECHGPSQQMRGFRLDRRKDALPNRIGANGVRIVPGKSEASRIYQRLIDSKAGPRMPPTGPLAASQIALIKTWIDEGADWPDVFSGDRSTAPADAVVESMLTTLRNGQSAAFQRLVRTNPDSINARGRSGWTPLMYAAVYGKPDDVRLLLDNGADPDALNDDGATALMYAVDDAAKMRLLLDKGANPNVRSGQGRTALLIAAGLTGTLESVRLLLDKGADINAQLTSSSRGVISAAVGAGNEPVLRLLLARGASTKTLGLAGGANCSPCLDLLIPFADERELSGALQSSVAVGNIPVVQKLLERGATPSPDLMRTVAVSSTSLPVHMIQTLFIRGAKVDWKTSTGTTLIDFAARQGKTELVTLLREAGARGEIVATPSFKPKPAPSGRAAIERTLPLLQRSDVMFIEKAGCVSCHNNSLTAMTVSAARAHGLPVDDRIAKAQLQKIGAFLLDNSAGGMENIGIPGGVDTVSYILLGLAAENYPSDTITDVWARYLRNLQREDGSIRVITDRPPLESSDFQVTAASVRALRTYGLKSQEAAYRKSIAAAVKWLETAPPKDTEDYAYKILGLVWGGGNQDVLRRTARELLAQQRPDGGWSQMSTIASDAYATGQALVSIAASRAVPTNNPDYQRGLRFLLSTQLEDGSWYVRTRSAAIQPHFDSGFPHGHDQFISAAATNWATMALVNVVR